MYAEQKNQETILAGGEAPQARTMVAGNETFERQFAETKRLELPNGDCVEYVTIRTAEGEQKPWVVFIGGFATSKDSYKEELASIAQSGRRIIFLNPAFDRRLPEDFTADLPRHIPETIRGEAEVLKKVLENEGVAVADIVGHSRGALVAVTLLSAHPQLARKIIVDNPAGIVSGMSLGKIAWRSLAEYRAHRGRGVGGNTPSDIIGELTNHPITRIKELKAIANMDIKPLLKEIIERRKASGIGPKEVILLNAYSDRIFPAKEVEQAVGASGTNRQDGGHNFLEYADRWAYYANKNLGHGKTPADELAHAKSELHAQLLDPDNPRNWRSVITEIVNEE